MKSPHKRTGELLSYIAMILLALYVGSYFGLSMAGRYEPFTIGLMGVKSYGWAPRGFVTNGRWNRLPIWIYYPLLRADMHFWHREQEAFPEE